MVSVLFVCLGNICRSPAAEGVLRHLAEEQGYANDLQVASCGIGDWHVGEPADYRMRSAAKSRGVTLDGKAQKFLLSFFDTFDHILVVDEKMLKDLFALAPPSAHPKLNLITHFSPKYKDQPIPDPYYGGEAGFANVLDIIHDSCKGLLMHIFQTDIKTPIHYS